MQNPNLSGRQFFHGSDAELHPGDRVLPISKTGAQRWDQRMGLEGEVATGPHSNDHVYHSSRSYDAASFGKHVYEVRPTADCRVDPEDDFHNTGVRWTRSKSARVVRKVEHPL